MKKIWTAIKPYLRLCIFVSTLFFLAIAFKNHATEVASIRITGAGWVKLAIAFLFTSIAHTWAGWVYFWILNSFKQPVKREWVIQIYLKTNLAKYIPGNIWHYYGRILAVTSVGGSLAAATLSVLLEPLLMASAALIITLIGNQHQYWGWQIISLIGIGLAIHPKILNPILQLLMRFKRKTDDPNSPMAKMESYPFLPLIGEVGFLGLRGSGFLFTLLAITPVSLTQLPMVFSGFSFAWLLGLVVPGAPGGIGVFEATAIALFHQNFSVGIILSSVALFRIVSILAEVSLAGIARFWR